MTGLLTGFLAFGAATFFTGVDAAFLVATATVFLDGVAAVFLAEALIAGVAVMTFLANGHLAGAVLVEDWGLAFLLLVAMIISFKE